MRNKKIFSEDKSPLSSRNEGEKSLDWFGNCVGLICCSVKFPRLAWLLRRVELTFFSVTYCNKDIAAAFSCFPSKSLILICNQSKSICIYMVLIMHQSAVSRWGPPRDTHGNSGGICRDCQIFVARGCTPGAKPRGFAGQRYARSTISGCCSRCSLYALIAGV